MKDVKDALSKLKGSLPRLKAGSDVEKAVLKALQALSPVVGSDEGMEAPKPAGLGAPMAGPAPRPAFPGAAPGMMMPGPRG